MTQVVLLACAQQTTMGLYVQQKIYHHTLDYTTRLIREQFGCFMVVMMDVVVVWWEIKW